jgi:branched-chain amino acid transport system substrate-binding protein
MQDYLAVMKKYLPNIDTADSGSYAGYNVTQTLGQVLRQCGDELTRELHAAGRQFARSQLPMLLPGIKVNTSPSNFFPVKQMQLVKFEGDGWVLFGDVLGGT